MVLDILTEGLDALKQQVGQPLTTLADSLKKGVYRGPQLDIVERSKDIAKQQLLVNKLLSFKYLLKNPHITSDYTSIVQVPADWQIPGETLSGRYQYLDGRLVALKTYVKGGKLPLQLDDQGKRDSNKTKKLSQKHTTYLLGLIEQIHTELSAFYDLLIQPSYQVFALPLTEKYDANTEKKVYKKVFRSSVDKQIEHEYDMAETQKTLIRTLHELQKTSHDSFALIQGSDQKKSSQIRSNKIVTDLLTRSLDQLKKQISIIEKDEQTNLNAWQFFQERFAQRNQQMLARRDKNLQQTVSHEKKSVRQTTILGKRQLTIYKKLQKYNDGLAKTLNTSLVSVDKVEQLIDQRHDLVDQLHYQQLVLLGEHQGVLYQYLKDVAIQRYLLKQHEQYTTTLLALLKDRVLSTKLLTRLKKTHINRGKKACSLAVDITSRGAGGMNKTTQQLQSYQKQFKKILRTYEESVEDANKQQLSLKQMLKTIEQATEMLQHADSWLQIVGVSNCISQQISFLNQDLGLIHDAKEFFENYLGQIDQQKHMIEVQFHDIQQSLAITQSPQLEKTYKSLNGQLATIDKIHQIVGAHADQLESTYNDVTYLMEQYSGRLDLFNKLYKKTAKNLGKYTKKAQKNTNALMQLPFEPEKLSLIQLLGR